MWKKKQCWHRDFNLSYVSGPDQQHVICWFPMFCPTPDDGCARDFVVASRTGLPDPWLESPLAPLAIGDVWLGNALTVHPGGICPTTNPNRPRVFGFVSVGTSRSDNINTCPVVVAPWASKAAASPQGSQGPHATCGAVGCEVLLLLALLCVGRMILKQGARGVPIGEFWSAQLADTWLAWREYTCLFDAALDSQTTQVFKHDVQRELQCECSEREEAEASATCPTCHEAF